MILLQREKDLVHIAIVVIRTMIIGIPSIIVKSLERHIAHKSFIDYECQLAYNAWLYDDIKIVVLYNAASVNKSKCPEKLRNIGKHVSMKSYNFRTGSYEYDYQKVRAAIED